jgi:glutamine synthetase
MTRKNISSLKVPDLLKNFLEQYPKIEFIKCQFADMQGNTREVTTTYQQLLTNGTTSVDGSSVFGKIIPPTESDMLLVPDFATLYPLPWDPNTARVICNVFHPPESEDAPIKPFAGCGRSILQKVVSRMEILIRKNLPKTLANAKIIKMRAYFAPEVEFLLLPKKYDWTGIHRDCNLKNNYYFLPMYGDRDLAHQEIINYLGMMGLKKEKYHTEVTSLQCEIGIGHGNVLKIADGTMTIKYIIEYVASKYGFRASFIPKFNEAVNGSGMHVHQNLSTTVSENGQEIKINLFFDPACPDGLSDLGRHYIAGLMKYSREITAITNPLPVSYKRLVPDAEAPTYISWDWLNRTALCRGHSKGTKKVRIEYRSPDPKCNPYLAFAAMLSAGLSGIEEKLQLRPNDNRNFYEDHSGVKELPGNLGEALAEMNQSKMLRKWLGKFVIDNLYKLGSNLWKEESRQVTDVDIERHL